MSQNTVETDTDASDGVGESGLIKSLREQLSKAKATEKQYLDDLQAFRAERAQARKSAVAKVVDGRGYPQAIVDVLLSKVEDASNEEFDKLLLDLTGGQASKDSDEGGTPAEPQTSVADLGQRVASAAASAGQGTDVLKKIAGAKTQAELLAVVREAGLDSI